MRRAIEHREDKRGLSQGCAFSDFFPVILLVTWPLCFVSTLILLLRLFTWVKLVKISGTSLAWSLTTWILALSAQGVGTVWVVKINSLHSTICSTYGDSPSSTENVVDAWLVLTRQIGQIAKSVGKIAVATYFASLLRPLYRCKSQSPRKASLLSPELKLK